MTMTVKLIDHLLLMSSGGFASLTPFIYLSNRSDRISTFSLKSPIIVELLSYN